MPDGTKTTFADGGGYRVLSGSGVDVSIGDTIIPADTQYSAQGFGVEGVEAKLLNLGESP